MGIPTFVWGILPFAAIALVLIVGFFKFFVNVGAKEIAIKERRYMGKKMPSGRVVATGGEVGIQADVLKPGLHFILWPIERIVDRKPLVEIASDELGVVEAIDGKPLPAGRIFAPDEANNAHDNFQKPIDFLTQGGVKGIQMRTLPPGKWPIHPYLFRVSIAKVTVVPQGQVGVVTAADGSSLDTGRLLGKSLEGHNHFQDAEAFISRGGQKGPQVEILTPGTYRILRESSSLAGGKNSEDVSGGRTKPGLFTVTFADAEKIKENEVGLVEALDGAAPPNNDFVAASVSGHDNFQNGSKFIQSGGQRGPQLDILRPGTYYINPMLFKVIHDSAKEVKPGEVAVVVSNCGLDPTDEIRRQMAREVQARLDALRHEHPEDDATTTNEDGDPATPAVPAPTTDPADKRLDSGNKEAYVVPSGFRGIQKDVVGPGRYYVNTMAATPIPIPTTNLTVEWTEGTQKDSFDPFEVVSKDGFKMRIEVMAVFRVKPEDAPFMVSKIGSIDNLKNNVMHPTIDSIFRNQASGSSAMNYLQNRHDEQLRAEHAVRAHLLPYHVDVVNVLIRHIHLPEELMNTQTAKILAEQNQSRFAAERQAEESRIQLESTRAQANNQAALMAETVGVQIADKKAEQRMKAAAGEAAYIKQTGQAEAEVTELKGRAQGVAYKEQVEALGQGGVALVQVIDKIAEKGLRITPDIVAGGSSGEGGGLGTLITAMLAKQLNDGATPGAPKAADKGDSSKK